MRLDEHVQAASRHVRINPSCATASGDEELKIVGEAADFTLPRKAASEDMTARTVNRHR